MNFESWGRYPKAMHLGGLVPRQQREVKDLIQSVSGTFLPRGKGRSYGDSCLNDGGYLLFTKQLNKIMAFDENSGVLRCESGVTLEEIIRFFLPRGWFLSVVPGTKDITVGGAIANDVHGKNHHVAGSFGNHILRFALIRSDGTLLVCSPDENQDWFKATIGGLGLTGVILWADIQLKKVPGPLVKAHFVRFDSVDEFFEQSQKANKNSEFTAAWIDAINFAKSFGHGIFMKANHFPDPHKKFRDILHLPQFTLQIPFDLPNTVLSARLVGYYNRLHLAQFSMAGFSGIQRIEKFLFPLDKIKKWNRLYGRRGFLQWQCVTPQKAGIDPIQAIFAEMKRNHIGAFLAVLKVFGATPSQGLLSFPMPGITLAMDFPNSGTGLFKMLDNLDDIVMQAGGRIYPAKDARMSQAVFEKFYPNYSLFSSYLDAKISSSFIRRVTGIR